MATQKFLAIDAASGNPVEVAPIQASAGAGSGGKIPALTDAGLLDLSMMPVGIGPDTLSIITSEALVAGAQVNIWNNAGVKNVRNADASAASGGKPAHGFVLAAFGSGIAALVYFNGEITGLSGLTPGAPMFLSDVTPGQASATVVTISGHLLQRIGTAVDTTVIQFQPNAGIVRA